MWMTADLHKFGLSGAPDSELGTGEGGGAVSKSVDSSTTGLVSTA